MNLLIARFRVDGRCWLLGMLLALGQADSLLAQPAVPSLDSKPTPSSANISLPQDAGQFWKTYDLSPYTKELTSLDRPQQAIVDWVLRETGTDVWFTDPFGVLNADRNTLRVYHNKQMQEIVGAIHERFVNGTTDMQLYGLRVMAVGNPNWRTGAQALMRSVPAQSPGVHAYLLSKENAAILMAMLRGRGDFRELSASDMAVHNGQSQVLEQVRGRNYVSDFRAVNGTWPPYMPVTGELKEGYRLHLSPLLSVDRQEVDLVVKCNIDQVEKLTNVNLDLPLANGQVYAGQINVPQVASWRLHERFRWPANQVLLLSCGVVAAPGSNTSNSLLGGGGFLGLDRVFSSTGDRADALLMIEYRGDAADRVPTAGAASRTASSPLSRGRY